tara:strand:+ start:2657 stop:2863 length:207 start_codon:yes stop_codon:yes gene_type:complete
MLAMFPSAWQIAVVVILIILLFGRGKISSLMSDLAKGIKSFKKGMSDNPNSSNQDTDNKDEKDDSTNS